MVIALGVTIKGEKVVPGFVQTATENERVCSAFLGGLLDRGLSVDQGVLCVIDGAKGLRKAVDKVLTSKAAVQRCQWHKRENMVGYLSTSQQTPFRRKLQRAYDQPTYTQAQTALKKVRGELSLLNQSAVASLDEGFEETLTIHCLGLFKELGRSFKTTNCIENLNSLLAHRTGKWTAGGTRSRSIAGWPGRSWTSSHASARWLGIASCVACVLHYSHRRSGAGRQWHK